MTENELIELLLLRNRGAIDAPEMHLFDSDRVESVLLEILHAGYLRRLDSIPAMQIFSGSYPQFVFSATGRVRFYHLERLLSAASSGDDTSPPVTQ